MIIEDGVVNATVGNTVEHISEIVHAICCIISKLSLDGKVLLKRDSSLFSDTKSDVAEKTVSSRMIEQGLFSDISRKLLLV